MRTPTPDEPLRVVELFSGIGAQAMALKVAGIPHVVVGTSEIDAAAMRSYEAIHGPVPQLGDITELEELPNCDLVTYSFPCIRGDQLVRTGRGLVPIRDVKEGDTVLTHRGRYMPVTCVRMTGIHGTMAVRTPMDTLVCTRDHMVLTRLRLGSHAKESRENHTSRTFTAPYWCPAAALTGSNYVGCPVPVGEGIPEVQGSIYEDGVIWMPVKEVRTLNPTRVYDIEVEEDHSFTASGMIVHNCQDLSVAGLRRGMDEGSGTRSALLWEVGRLLERAAERERDSPSASSWRTCRRY